MPPAATVVIPTFGPAPHIEELLHGLANQTFRDFDVVLVDNNPVRSIDTGLLARANVPGVVVHESRNGLQIARNTGVKCARGAYVAFLDDDALPRPTWLQQLVRGLERYGASAVGGSVFLKLSRDVAAPPWLTNEHRAVLSELLYSGEDIPMLGDDLYIVGANMCIARGAFVNEGMFDLRFDRTAKSLRSSGELEFTRRLQAAGERVSFIASAHVDHMIGGTRLTKTYFLRRYYWQGRSDALLESKWGRPIRFGHRNWRLNLASLARAIAFLVRARDGAERTHRAFAVFREFGYAFQSAILAIGGMGKAVN